MVEELHIKSKIEDMSYYNKNFIRNLELTNFMCHSKLLVKFRKKITCISGRNGSGKSAIMVAIGIILGRKANSLERGRSNKFLIKKGKEHAIIRIELNNFKEFVKEFFGDRIFLERTIRKEGTSSFKIMNSRNKIYSRKVEDLNHILDFYSVAIGNPLNFLSQDNSKKFLNIVKTNILYELFEKGTELESIHEMHEDALNTILEMEENIERTKAENEKNVKKMGEKLMEKRQMEEIEKNNDVIEKLEGELQWSPINQLKLKASEFDDELLDCEEKISMKKNELSKIELEIENFKIEKERIENENIRRRQQIEKEKEKLEEEKKELILEMTEAKNDANSNSVKIKELEEELNRLNKKLKPENYGEKIERAKNEILMFEDRLIQYRNFTEYLTDEKINEDNFNNDKDLKLFALRKQLNFLKKMKNDKHLFFGDNFRELNAEIKKTKFSDKIIGPIGLSLKLSNENRKWAKALSIILRNSLNAFIVFNNRDREILLGIFRRYRRNFPIIVPSSKRINFPKKNNKNLVLNFLEYEDECIKDMLVLLENIESTVLVENRREAYKELNREIDTAYTIEGDRIRIIAGSITEFIPLNTKEFFSVEGISEKENEIEEIMQNKFNRNLKTEKLIEKLNARNLSEALKICSNTEKIENEIEREKRKIKQAEYEIEAIKNLENKEEKKLQIEEDLAQLRTQNSEVKNFIEIQDIKIDEISKKIDGTNFKRVNCERPIFFDDKIRKQNEIYNLEDKNRILTEKVEILRKNIDEKTEKIIEIPFTESVRNEDDIKIEIEYLREQIKQAQSKNSTEKLTEEIEKIKNSIDFKKSIIDEFYQKIQSAKIENEKRIEKREILKKNMANSMGETFNSLTNRRNYDGELNFDHGNRTLDLRMRVCGNKNYGSKSTLSGGERSFAGISLLISIWSFMNCPLKVLDEFDVFMDNLNRKTVIEMLFKYFSTRDDQVILITPLSTAEMGDNCDIITLEKFDR